MKSGETHALEIRYPNGHEKNPMSDADIDAKFHDLCGGRLDAARRKKALSVLWQLEEVTDTASVTKLFAVS